jgi:hypothetical protein
MDLFGVLSIFCFYLSIDYYRYECITKVYFLLLELYRQDLEAGERVVPVGILSITTTIIITIIMRRRRRI